MNTPLITTTLTTLTLGLTIAGCAHESPDRSSAEPVPVVNPAPEFENDRLNDGDASTTVIATAENEAGAARFVAALRASGLAEELSQSDALVTLLVPVDDHFDASMLGTDPDEIRKNLSYYIVPGRLTTSELSNLQKSPTRSGQEVDILVGPNDSYLAVNQARVLTPNLAASNGVVHVIDSMLLPPDHPLATKLRQGSPNGRVQIDQDILRVCGIDEPKTFFGFDSAQVRDSAEGTLGELAKCVVSGPLAGKSLRLEGYADPRGSAEYNRTLAGERASSVKSMLETEGVPSDQLESVSFGERYAHDSMPIFWDYDRRVDILLVDPDRS